MASRRKYTRPIGQRRYRRMFFISTEGTKTEPQYFCMFNDENTVVHVKVLKHRGSNPETVLREMKRHLGEKELRKSDAAWLIVDKDRWSDTQLQSLHEWNRTDERYGLAVSNPKFEYWLVLHFEDGDGIVSARDCVRRLKKHLPGYDKNLRVESLRSRVAEAVFRAERKDTPLCPDWPRTTGTTVYRLVKDLVNRR